MYSKQFYIYIIGNQRNGTLYTGVTNDLNRRVFQHKAKSADGFSARYGVDKLYYYEMSDNPYAAITREKQLKGGSRKKKLALIESMNPEWKDLSDTI